MIRTRAIGCVLICLGMVGCHVPNRPYNPVPSVPPADGVYQTASIVRVGADADADRMRTDTPDQQCDPAAAATLCMAFVEFDDMGELWDPHQVPAALNLIDASGKTTPPVVVTFIHGWKNNANDDATRLEGQNKNIIGFEGMLEDLKKHYYPDSPVVGVYIGWRGDFIQRYWPVLRQFSYFNREHAAIRLPSAALTSVLTQVTSRAHGHGTGLARGTAITIGHSFGALVLERALTQATVEKVLDEGTGSSTLGDLVVFVNSAAAASEGKQMLNFLATSGRRYYDQDGCEVPLFLSVSSLGDAATRFLMPVGHGLPFLGLLFEGSTRSYSDPQPPGIPTDKPYYLSTTAHMPALQSHEILEVQTAGVQAAASSSVCARLTAPFSAGGRTYLIRERPSRWNTTPYWVMEMPASIVPDHNGIFNTIFDAVLIHFLPTSAEVKGTPRQLRLSGTIGGFDSFQPLHR